MTGLAALCYSSDHKIAFYPEFYNILHLKHNDNKLRDPSLTSLQLSLQTFRIAWI